MDNSKNKSAIILSPDLEDTRITVKAILDKNIMLRSAAVALGIYDKTIIYLPELLIIIAENPRGKQIMKELGLDDIETLINSNGNSK